VTDNKPALALFKPSPASPFFSQFQDTRPASRRQVALEKRFWREGGSYSANVQQLGKDAGITKRLEEVKAKHRKLV
jgi:hypothetical protein